MSSAVLQLSACATMVVIDNTRNALNTMRQSAVTWGIIRFIKVLPFAFTGLAVSRAALRFAPATELYAAGQLDRSGLGSVRKANSGGALSRFQLAGPVASQLMGSSFGSVFGSMQGSAQVAFCLRGTAGSSHPVPGAV